MLRHIQVICNGMLLLVLIGALGLAVFGLIELQAPSGSGGMLLGFGLGVAIAITVMFILPLELRVNLAMAGIASLFALWFGSWLLYDGREVSQQRIDERVEAAQEAGVPFDTRTLLELVQDLRARGIEAFPPLLTSSLFKDTAGRPGEQSILPLAGVSRATTVVCNELGEYLIVQTDRFGFNNPDEAYDWASPVLLLGDSFAFGYCVPPGRDLAGHLRAEGVRVLNLGYPGTGPLIQLAQLREYGHLEPPRAIIWMYFQGNDLRDLMGEYGSRKLRRYLDPEHRQNLPARQHEIDVLWTEFKPWWDLEAPFQSSFSTLRDVLLLRPVRELLGIRFRPEGVADGPPDVTMKRFEEVLDRLVTEADELDAPLYFVYLPVYSQFVGREPRYRDDVLTAVRDRDIPVVDFEARLLATGDPTAYYPFGLHGHLNEMGFALLAEYLVEEVPELRVDVLPDDEGPLARSDISRH